MVDSRNDGGHEGVKRGHGEEEGGVEVQAGKKVVQFGPCWRKAKVDHKWRVIPCLFDELSVLARLVQMGIRVGEAGGAGDGKEYLVRVRAVPVGLTKDPVSMSKVREVAVQLSHRSMDLTSPKLSKNNLVDLKGCSHRESMCWTAGGEAFAVFMPCYRGYRSAQVQVVVDIVGEHNVRDCDEGDSNGCCRCCAHVLAYAKGLTVGPKAAAGGDDGAASGGGSSSNSSAWPSAMHAFLQDGSVRRCSGLSLVQGTERPQVLASWVCSLRTPSPASVQAVNPEQWRSSWNNLVGSFDSSCLPSPPLRITHAAIQPAPMERPSSRNSPDDDEAFHHDSSGGSFGGGKRYESGMFGSFDGGVTRYGHSSVSSSMSVESEGGSSFFHSGSSNFVRSGGSGFFHSGGSSVGGFLEGAESWGADGGGGGRCAVAVPLPPPRRGRSDKAGAEMSSSMLPARDVEEGWGGSPPVSAYVVPAPGFRGKAASEVMAAMPPAASFPEGRREQQQERWRRHANHHHHHHHHHHHVPTWVGGAIAAPSTAIAAPSTAMALERTGAGGPPATAPATATAPGTAPGAASGAAAAGGEAVALREAINTKMVGVQGEAAGGSSAMAPRLPCAVGGVPIRKETVDAAAAALEAGTVIHPEVPLLTAVEANLEEDAKYPPASPALLAGRRSAVVGAERPVGSERTPVRTRLMSILGAGGAAASRPLLPPPSRSSLEGFAPATMSHSHDVATASFGPSPAVATASFGPPSAAFLQRGGGGLSRSGDGGDSAAAVRSDGDLYVASLGGASSESGGYDGSAIDSCGPGRGAAWHGLLGTAGHRPDSFPSGRSLQPHHHQQLLPPPSPLHRAAVPGPGLVVGRQLEEEEEEEEPASLEDDTWTDFSMEMQVEIPGLRQGAPAKAAATAGAGSDCDLGRDGAGKEALGVRRRPFCQDDEGNDEEEEGDCTEEEEEPWRKASSSSSLPVPLEEGLLVTSGSWDDGKFSSPETTSGSLVEEETVRRRGRKRKRRSSGSSSSGSSSGSSRSGSSSSGVESGDGARGTRERRRKRLGALAVVAPAAVAASKMQLWPTLSASSVHDHRHDGAGEGVEGVGSVGGGRSSRKGGSSKKCKHLRRLRSSRKRMKALERRYLRDLQELQADNERLRLRLLQVERLFPAAQATVEASGGDHLPAQERGEGDGPFGAFLDGMHRPRLDLLLSGAGADSQHHDLDHRHHHLPDPSPRHHPHRHRSGFGDGKGSAPSSVPSELHALGSLNAVLSSDSRSARSLR